MKKIQHIDPFFFTHPMNGLLGILLLLVMIPLTNIFIALVITYIISILGLLTLNFFSDINVQTDSIMVGTVTIVSFSVFSIIIDLIYHYHYIGYQLLLLGIYIPVAIVSLLFLRDKGNGLSSIDELCPTSLQRQLLINEHKRITKRFVLLSVLTLIAIYISFFYGYTDDNCARFHSRENIVGVLIVVPFVFLYVFEMLRLWFLKNKLKTEVWLSLVDDNNRELGRIAKDSICNYNGAYNLSLIRVITFCKDYVYIECQSGNNCDTPFLGWLEQGNEIYGQTKMILASHLEDKCKCNLQKLFAYKTVFNNQINTIVSLYCLRLDSMDELKDKSGKWWRTEDLKDEINNSILSDVLKRELAYIEELTK